MKKSQKWSMGIYKFLIYTRSIKNVFLSRALDSLFWALFSPLLFLLPDLSLIIKISSFQVIILFLILKMPSKMDKAMLALSLQEEEDVPFDMPDLTQFYSCERNVNSLIGRILNPRIKIWQVWYLTCQGNGRNKQSLRHRSHKWKIPVHLWPCI